MPFSAILWVAVTVFLVAVVLTAVNVIVRMQPALPCNLVFWFSGDSKEGERVCG